MIVADGELRQSRDPYAWERPDDRFPVLEAGGARFVAEDLGHPLIPEEACVRNDVRLDADHALYVVSGSNMSGKSTLLRSIGVAAVLAQAGAPVCARALRIAPLSVGDRRRLERRGDRGCRCRGG